MICHISSQNNWVQTSLGFCFSICVSILAKTTSFSLHPPYRPQPLILVIASVGYSFSLSGSYKVIYWDVLGTVQNRATGKNEQRTDDRIWIALVGWGRGVGASSGSKQLLLTVTKYLHSSISGNASPAVCSGSKWGGRQDQSNKMFLSSPWYLSMIFRAASLRRDSVTILCCQSNGPEQKVWNDIQRKSKSQPSQAGKISG